MSRKSLVPIQLPADPTQPLEAVTKQYVDARVADEVAVSTTDPGLGYELWYDSDAPTPTITYPEEVIIGPAAPSDAATNLWVNTVDNNSMYAYVGGAWTKVAADVVVPNEVAIGTADPIGTFPEVELWFDTDAPTSLPQDRRWDTAWGIVATQEGANDIVTGVAPYQLAAVTFTAVAGRLYEAHYDAVGVFTYASGTVMHTQMKLDASTILAESRFQPAAGAQVTLDVSCGRFTATAGTHTVAVVHQYPATTPVLTVSGTWTPWRLVVSDAGPVSGAPQMPDPTPAWQPLTLAATWTNFGSGFNTAQCRKVGDEVTIRGMIQKTGTVNPGDTFATLPAGFSPSTQLMFVQVISTGSGFARLDASPGGVLQYWGPSAASPWLSINLPPYSVTP